MAKPTRMGTSACGAAVQASVQLLSMRAVLTSASAAHERGIRGGTEHYLVQLAPAHGDLFMLSLTRSPQHCYIPVAGAATPVGRGPPQLCRSPACRCPGVVVNNRNYVLHMELLYTSQQGSSPASQGKPQVTPLHSCRTTVRYRNRPGRSPKLPSPPTEIPSRQIQVYPGKHLRLIPVLGRRG